MIKINRQSKDRGFSLVELLVVIGIIGVLGTLAMAGINYARGAAKESQAKSDISQIYTAISMLANDTNEWPGHQTVNEVETSGDPNEICGEDASGDNCANQLSSNSSGIIATDGSFSGWSGPYMRVMPLDPWGREYFFDTDYLIDADNNPCGCGGGGCDNFVVLGSYGPDGEGVPTSGGYGCDDIIKIIR